MSLVEWPQYDKLQRELQSIYALDLKTVKPLLIEWQKILVEDNRKGVLSGLDKDGANMIPVTYRTGIATKTAARRGKARGRTVGEFHGFGPFASGLHGNLTTAQYKALTGPPLAPQGDHSRVIANYQTASGQVGPGHFVAEGKWFDVVDIKGNPFLEHHFDGDGYLPRRDLRGVRPWGIAEAKKALGAFVDELIGA